MDPNNFVGPTPGGGFVAYSGGKKVYEGSDQRAAESTFNASQQSSGAGNGYGGDSSYNQGAASLAEQQAEAAWTHEYQMALVETGNQRLALDRANAAFEHTIQEAGVTGIYNGQNTLQARGQYNDEALRMLGLQAGLSGPANAFKYAQLLTGTPGGLADIVRSAQGQYRLPTTGGGAPGSPTPMTIESMIQDIGQYSPTAGGGYGGPPAAGTYQTGGTPGQNVTPGTAPLQTPQQAAVGTYSTRHGDKTLDQMKAELTSQGVQVDPNDATAIANAYAQASGAQVAPKQSSYIPQYGALPPPNQWNPQNQQNMTPGQRSLFSAAYQNQGWMPDDLTDLYAKSLKGYGGPAGASLGF